MAAPLSNIWFGIGCRRHAGFWKVQILVFPTLRRPVVLRMFLRFTDSLAECILDRLCNIGKLFGNNATLYNLFFLPSSAYHTSKEENDAHRPVNRHGDPDAEYLKAHYRAKHIA